MTTLYNVVSRKITHTSPLCHIFLLNKSIPFEILLNILYTLYNT